MDDWQLLQEYAETGDTDAFSALVERHLGLVYATALRITGDPSGAEDVSQATFILLEEKADLLKPRGSLASWLYQSAVFKARKHVTRERNRRDKEKKGAMMTMEATSEENDWSEIRSVIDTALESLGEDDRAIIIARHLRQMSLKEAGSELGISEAAAGKRVARAVTRLRDWFESRGINCTGDVLGSALGGFAMMMPPPQLAEQVVSSALGTSIGTAVTQTTGELISNWLSSRSAMVAVFAVAAVFPAVISMRSTEDKGGRSSVATRESSDAVPIRLESPVTSEESEWVALWNEHAPPNGSFGELMAAIGRVEDPLKRDVFRSVAYTEWAAKGLPIPDALSLGESVALFEQMLDRDPRRAGEMAASLVELSTTGKVYLDISSKLVELAGRNPEGLARFINLVEPPSWVKSDYGIGSWQTGKMALPPQTDEKRAADIRDAVARLAESDRGLAEAAVESLEGWHREQALAGLIIGQVGTDLDAAVSVLFERSENPEVTGNVLESLLMKWIDIDPRHAIETLGNLWEIGRKMERMPSGRIFRGVLRSELLAVYAERDFEGAMALLSEVEVPTATGTDDRFYEVLAAQVRKAPVRTLETLEAIQGDAELFRVSELMHSIDKELIPLVWDWCAGRDGSKFVGEAADWLLSATSDDDPMLAIDLYLQHPGLAKRFPSSELGYGLCVRSFEEADMLLGRLSEKERVNVIFSMLRNDHLKWELSDCLSLYERLPMSHRDDPASKISSSMADSNPAAAASWALSQPEGGIRNAAIRGLINTWSEYDVTAASGWVDQLEPGMLRDSAVRSLAFGIAEQGDQESAIAWAEDLSDSKSRFRTVSDILGKVARKESFERAEAILEESNLPNNEKESLHEKLKSER